MTLAQSEALDLNDVNDYRTGLLLYLQAKNARAHVERGPDIWLFSTRWLVETGLSGRIDAQAAQELGERLRNYREWAEGVHWQIEFTALVRRK